MPASTPRKTAAAKKTATPRRDKPTAPAFNFDTWDRGGDVEPFPVVIGGKRYVSLDPADIDFRELEGSLEQPVEMFRLLFPDDHEEILANRIPVGALAQFSQAIFEHFDLEDFTAAQS